jgi:CRISPR system Cascade subunit CasE
MSQPLYLIHLRPNLNRLLPWAQRQGLVPDKGQGDLGYAFHAALKAAFADLAPQPFCYQAVQGLLGYSKHGEDLRGAAALAVPEIADMLGLDETPQSPGLMIRRFPQIWKQGQALAFEVRVRPIVRSKEGRERDAYLSAVEHTPKAETGLTRESVYVDWLKRQFKDAAHLHEVQMKEFSLSTVVRRSASQVDGARTKQPVRGPNAVFSGILQIQNSLALGELIERGIGRHRAFGFGMLLLKPAVTVRN